MNRFMTACIQPPGGETGSAIDLAYEKKGDIHEPSFLKVSWGDRWGIRDGGGFQCRLKSVDIEYTSFDRDGRPMGMQVMGPFGADKAVLEFAMAYESVTAHLDVRPNLIESS